MMRLWGGFVETGREAGTVGDVGRRQSVLWFGSVE